MENIKATQKGSLLFLPTSNLVTILIGEALQPHFILLSHLYAAS